MSRRASRSRAREKRQHVLPREAHRPGGRLDQPQDAPAGRRLAAPGFADQPEGLALVDAEGHVVDGAHDRALAKERSLSRKLLGEVATSRSGITLTASRMPVRPPGRGGSTSQRVRCPRPGTPCRPACALAHGSKRSGHRGANAQPGGSWPSGGTVALDGAQARARRAARDRRHQPPGVGMLRIARTGLRTGACSTIRPAYITATRSAISATTPRSWVMSRSARPSSRWSVAQQVEDLGLDRDVERGGRLVGDDQRRLAGERHRDERPLAHAARQLVRVVARRACAARGCATASSSSTACARAVAPRGAAVHDAASRRSGCRS